MAQVKISFLVPSYNEAARIGHVLAHATQWADEVVVMDKGSTDATSEICRSYGEKVRVVAVPYSDRGNEDMTVIPQYVTEGWIFFGTCSEVPTRALIEKCREVIDQRGDELDLIYVPRLMHYFGLHCAPDHGGVCHYPFLFHKDRVVITNDIHDNFHARDPARTYRIPYAEDCCVYHMTHATARGFWLSSLAYFEMETKKKLSPDKALREAFKNIEKLSRRLTGEKNWVPFYCAFATYELGKALFVWEQQQGRDAGGIYNRELTQYLIEKEWTHTVASSPLKKPSLPAPPDLKDAGSLQTTARLLAVFPYSLMKLKLWLSRLF